MIVSNQARLVDNKQLARHRRKQPAKYELVLKSGNDLIRYYADEFTHAKAEAIKATLQREGDLKSPFVYLEKLENDDWYGCAFDNAGVNIEATDGLEALLELLSYDIHISPTLLVANGELNQHKDKQGKVSPINEEQLKAFALVEVKKSLKSKVIPILGGMGLLIACFWYFSGENEKPVAVAEQPKSEKQIFLEGFESNILVSDAIDNATNIFVEAKLAPEPIEIGKIELDGDRLVTSLNLNGARKKIVRDWLSESKNISTHFNLDNSTIIFALPHVGQWDPVPVSTYKRNLVDALEWLGAKVILKSKSQFDDISVQYYELEINAHLGQLGIISGLFDTPSVTIKSFNMTKLDAERVRLIMSFNLQGLDNEI